LSRSHSGFKRNGESQTHLQLFNRGLNERNIMISRDNRIRNHAHDKYIVVKCACGNKSIFKNFVARRRCFRSSLQSIEDNRRRNNYCPERRLPARLGEARSEVRGHNNRSLGPTRATYAVTVNAQLFN